MSEVEQTESIGNSTERVSLFKFVEYFSDSYLTGKELHLYFKFWGMTKNKNDSSISSLTGCFVVICSLWDNKIGDKGGKGLGEGLKHNTSLKELK